MKKLLIFIILFCSSALYTVAQEDIRIKQDGKDIIIEYDLEQDATSVKLYVSIDNGITFHGPMKYVSGDVGKVMAGTNKQIRWNVITEWGELKGNISFKLVKELKKQYHTHTLFLLNGAFFPSSQPQLSYGVTFGRVRRVGWYGSVLLNTTPASSGDYSSSIEGGLAEGIPFYSGEQSFSRFAVNAGGVARLGESVYLYAGAGYGYRNIFWELLNKELVKHMGFSYYGLSAETGLILKIKNVVVSAGASSINADYMDFKIGFGWHFRSKNAK